MNDQEYRDLLNRHAEGRATIAELRGEAAGIIAAQRHSPDVKKMIREISKKTGDPVEEIEDRIFANVRAKLLPTSTSTSTTTPPA